MRTKFKIGKLDKEKLHAKQKKRKWNESKEKK